MLNKYFKGYYFKHQKDGQTVALIPGTCNEGAFVQVITNDKSYNYYFDSIKFGEEIRIGDCIFSKRGIFICLPNIKGQIKYSSIVPIRYDIMGIFKYFPMECRHGIVSMRHNLAGNLNIDGKEFDFTDGVGYIEKDSGQSFPKSYLWINCNDLPSHCSITTAIAEIPFMGIRFNVCICVIVYCGREYRFANYLGVKIIQKSEDIIELNQREFRFCIEIINKNEGNPLEFPINGRMSGIVRENNNTSAKFCLYKGNELIFELESANVSYENYTFSQNNNKSILD